MTAQRLQERLEAPADQAAQRGAFGLHVTDPGRAPHLAGRGGTDETDLYSPYRQFLSHVSDARKAGQGPASVELPIRCLAGRVLNRGERGAV